MLQGLQDEPCLWNHWKLPRARLPWSLRWPKGSAEAIFDAQEFGDFLIYPQAGSSESSGSSFGTIKIQYPFGIAKFMLQIDIPSGYLYNIAMENHHF